MAEYNKDYYTRAFVDMLTTLELELVRYEDGIGIEDMDDVLTTDNERFDDAVDVVDYIRGTIDDAVIDQFLNAVDASSLREAWDNYSGWKERSGEEFPYDKMLSFMDEHEAFKTEWQFLIYEPTDMLLKHLDDVDLDLAVELTNELNIDYNQVFEEMLNVMDFDLDKYEDGFGLVDRQGANLGDIESDRFDSAEQVIDRLDTYLDDAYLGDLDEAWEAEGFEGERPQTAEEWVSFMNEHRDFKEEFRHEYDVMNMIAYRCGDIDLNKVFDKELVNEKAVQYNKTQRTDVER